MDARLFQIKLLEECEIQGLTLERGGETRVNVYALARVMNPVNPWTAERVIRRWLREENPTMPSVESRQSLALALGRPPDFFGKGSSPRRRRLEWLMSEMADLLNHNREMERVA